LEYLEIKAESVFEERAFAKASPKLADKEKKSVFMINSELTHPSNGILRLLVTALLNQPTGRERHKPNTESVFEERAFAKASPKLADKEKKSVFMNQIAQYTNSAQAHDQQ
jgi:1,6-anhydro-N-acetylmuramate kinase